MAHSLEKNLGELQQNGSERFDFGFLDSPGGDPIQPSRNGDPNDKFDPNTVGQDDPTDFVTVEWKIRDRTTGAFRAPVVGENAPVGSDLLYIGPPEGYFDILQTGQGTTLTDDLTNEDWTIHWSGQVNGQPFTDWEIVTVVPDGGGSFSQPTGYGDDDLIKTRSGVSFVDLGLVDEAAYTAHVQSLNRRVSRVVDQLVGHDFLLHANEVEDLDGTNLPSMLLKGRPVVSIASVLEDGVAVPTAEYRLQTGDALGRNAGVLERKPPNVWIQGWNRYRVTYTWGYEAAPSDVQHVVEGAVLRLLQSGKVDQGAAGLSSESMDGFSASYDRTSLREAFTEDDHAVLRQHRRLVAV